MKQDRMRAAREGARPRAGSTGRSKSATGRRKAAESRTAGPRAATPARLAHDGITEPIETGEDGIARTDEGGEPVPAGPGLIDPEWEPASTDGRSDAEEHAAAGAGPLVRYDPLARYLSEIGRYAPLDREEELRVARLFRETRDPEAAAVLVRANLLLVVKIARLFRRTVANLLDLIQEGNVGLLQALDRYDPEVGVRFSTYASWWIKAYILKYLLDNVRMVRVGTTNARRKLLYNLNREKRQLEEAGFTVGPKLLAEKFGVSEKDVIDVEQSLAGGDVSLDAPMGGEDGRPRAEVMPAPSLSAEEELAAREFREIIDAKLAIFRKGLPPREQAILEGRLLADEPLTLQELGDRFGITREAVRLAEKKLTDRLREYLTAELGEEAVLQFRPRR